MQKVDLAELRRLWEETTPGEWALAWEDGKTGVLASMIGKLVAFIGNPDPSDGYEPTRKANGEYIAAAHNALPALLDELEGLRTLCGEWSALCDEMCDHVLKLEDHIREYEGKKDDTKN